MSKITVATYDVGHELLWDDFVARAKNGVFLFQRRYLEYHADRFPDASLIFLNDQEQPVAVLPATARDGVLSSHGGLTFGGVVFGQEMKLDLMLEVFDTMTAYLRAHGITRVIYKAIPHIYHTLPAEEDLYALQRYGARLYRRDVSSTLKMTDRPPLSKGRKWAIKQGQKHGLQVERSFDFASFMAIEERLLGTKYDTRPVHSAAEITLLAERFPDNIKLFTAHRAGKMLAGVIIYESKQVAHAQYIGASDEGRSLGAQDVIINYLVEEYYATKAYFDFGISTEDEGRRLNTGLVENKQSYGARAIVYDFYEIDLGHQSVNAASPATP